VDLNGDGYMDILSGSWPGELFLFKGGPDRTFAAPEMIRYKNDEIINIGGGIEEQPDGRILITGNGKFEETPEGTFVMYHGKRIESTKDKRVAITGTASAAHAADWDGDGDFDLLVGDIRGRVYLIPNQGTAKSYAFEKEQRLLADGLPLEVGRNAGPFAADWDKDGDLDLLVGAGDGSVSLFRNEGKRKTPELGAAEQLVPARKISYGADAPREAHRGNRSKVCAADWNGDGLLDLLVGDFTTQKPDLPDPTPEEKAEHEKLRKELEGVNTRYGILVDKVYGRERIEDEEEQKKFKAEMNQIRERLTDLRSQLPPEYENHGWIWLFLRKS
jgi:hypothetical protein